MLSKIKNSKQKIVCDPEYLDMLTPFFTDPNCFLNHPSTTILKGSATDKTAIFLVNFGTQKLIIKRYHVSDAWMRIKNLWRKSYAARAWDNAQELQRWRVLIPQPRAFFEERCGLFYGTSYLIMEYVAGQRGCDYFSATARPKPEWEQIIINIATIAKQLHAARMVQRDFQYGNMLIVGPNVYLLDLEYIKQYRANNFLFHQAFAKMIRHFLHFVSSNPEAHQMFRIAFAVLAVSHNDKTPPQGY